MQLEPIQFDDPVPIFPLPNCVLFPGVVQPLHIFEPRYREMMRAAVAGQKVIAMALLEEGWEKRYYGLPPIRKRLCVGRVIAHELLKDGKYNVLLQGAARADLESEGKCEGAWGSYRVGKMQAVVDLPMSEAHEKLQRQVLREMFEKTALRDLTVTPALTDLMEESKDADNAVSAARLIDALAFSLVQEVAAKQKILEEDHVTRRGELLLRELVALATRLGPPVEKHTWPPVMGVN